MSYLSNNTRCASLTVNGVDYTDNLIEMNMSDSTANRQGCIATQGNIVLGTHPGGALIEDYDRNNFKRGQVVLVDLEGPEGVYRHPRGYLYVISTAYDVEAEQLLVEVGCRLVLIGLTENIEELVELVPMELDVAQQTFQSCCAGIAATGQYVWQDNQGALEVRPFFDGDTLSGTAAGEWVSVLGVTTNSVSPLVATGAIPQEIKLSYQVPDGGLNEDQRGRVDINETTSYYFLQYPVVNYERQASDASPSNPEGTLEGAGQPISASVGASSPSTGSCGNVPDKPAGSGQGNCNDGYQLVQAPLYVPAIRTSIQTTKYDGPGGQQNYSVTEVYGPAVEANQQFFADEFAYCRSVWASECNPNGACPYRGMNEILLSKTETTNEFGEANEVVKQITDTWQPRMMAARTSDWRSGNNNGVPQDFDPTVETMTDLFRVSRRETIFSQEENVNVQEDINYDSLTSRGVGISGGVDLDALNGVKTRTVRRSTTITALDIAPDIVNSPTTQTKELKTEILLETGDYYILPPPEAGPYILEEQIPIPLLFEDEQEIEDAVAAYSIYLARFTKGDAFGLQVGEGMRKEVASGYYPGMPFRYYDEKKDRVLALRMNSTTWGVSTTDAAFVTDGVWIGFSNGTITVPDNLVGNSTPDMSAPPLGPDGPPGGNNGSGGNPTPPTDPIDPGIDDETDVDFGGYSFNVDVFFYFSSVAETFTENGVQPPQPGPEDVAAKWTTTCYVGGVVVAPGGLLAVNEDGSMPLEYEGILVKDDATVINGDLFASSES